MSTDMAPWPTIRRGYGGAKFTDLVVFVERLVANHDYRALAVFVANDITGGEGDLSPAEVLELYQLLVKLVRKTHPDQPIYFIAITPTGSRFKVWPTVSTANELIRNYCESDPKLHFIATAKPYLNEQGRPRDELFVADRLHQNEDGYKLWGSIIKQHLQKTLPSK